VYWKPRYATRGQKHRAWVKQQARREAAARRAPRRTLLARFTAWLRGNN
jgi:hypothetical protein